MKLATCSKRTSTAAISKSSKLIAPGRLHRLLGAVAPHGRHCVKITLALRLDAPSAAETSTETWGGGGSWTVHWTPKLPELLLAGIVTSDPGTKTILKFAKPCGIVSIVSCTVAS